MNINQFLLSWPPLYLAPFKCRTEILKRTKKFLIAYCDHQHELGMQLEQVGYYEQAFIHFEEAIFCSEGLPTKRNPETYRENSEKGSVSTRAASAII
jgi:hypothetical protein